MENWPQGGSPLAVTAIAIWGSGGSCLENELDSVLKNKVIWQGEEAWVQLRAQKQLGA